MPVAPSVPPPRPRRPIPPRRRTFLLPLSLLSTLLILLLARLIPPPPASEQLSALNAAHPGRRALVLTAHPDDEVMFFAPSILALTEAGWDMWGLCLSTGNADGLGEVRRHELTSSYDLLGVAPEKVMVIDHPLLQDDFRSPWPREIIQSVLDAYLEEHLVDIVITFDPIGISSHPNHASLAHIRPSNTSVYRLSSPAIWKKYTGPLPSISSNIAGHVAASPFKPLISSLAPFFAWLPEGIIAQIGGALGKQRGQGTINLVSTPERYLRGVRAMWEHRTQMVWFRYAYLVFSTLMWVNELVPVPME